jgi:hypothetical protein
MIRNRHSSLSPFACIVLIPFPAGLRGCMYSSCRVTCHRCTHEWTYMGIRLTSLSTSRRPVKVYCSRCHTYVRLDARNAK